MQDNAATEMLIRYMDGELSETEKVATEKLLQEDVVLQERYQYLVSAIKAIKAQGLKQRVQTIQQAYLQEANEQDERTVKVIKPASFFKKWMRVAAILVAAIMGYGVVQYVATTNQSVYNDNFISYQLPVNRGKEQADNLNTLYNARNYNAVINAFRAKEPKDQTAYFVAAQSYLQLNNTAAAITAFQQVECINNKSINKYFEQETDYYLMLAYIKAGQMEAAKEKLDKITADKNHLFYNKANSISRTKLALLKWKAQ